MAASGIPELSLDQVAELSEGAEKAARDYVLSKVSRSRIVTLDVTVDAEGTKPLNISVDVTIVLSPLMNHFDVEFLTNEATKKAFLSIEEYLRELESKSKK